LTDDEKANRAEAYKSAAYSNAYQHFKNGEFRKSAESLLSLFSNPDEPSLKDAGIGAVKGAGQTVDTVSGMLNHVPVVGERLAPTSGVNALDSMTTLRNDDERGGAVVEGIGEFLLGDEALKTLSIGDRLLKAGKLAKMLEESPRLKRAVEIGMNAMRQGTVGTTQSLARGATPGEAVATGAVTGGSAGLLETGAEGIQAVAPTVRKIAGELIPVRASQGSAVADAAENVAASKPLDRFNVEQTQPAAKKAVGNVATEVRDTAAKKLAPSDTQHFKTALNEIAPKQPTPTEFTFEMPNEEKAGAKPVPFADLSSADQSRVLARAQELKTVTNGKLPPVSDLGEAAESVREQAKPTFQKLDELTADRDVKFSDYQKQEKLAWRRDDYDAAMKARAAQENILNEFSDQFDADDLAKAKSAWKQSIALDRVDNALEAKSVLQPTPVNLRPQGVPDPGVINGKNFSKQILDLRNKGVLSDAGLTPSHIQSLQDLGSLLEKGSNVHRLGKLVTGGGLVAEGIGLAVHPVAAGTAAAAAVPGYAMSQVLGRAMTDAAFNAQLVQWLRTGARIAPVATSQTARTVYNGASGLGQ
jgi:hypothetical protein